jgi:hypothetical protein
VSHLEIVASNSAPPSREFGNSRTQAMHTLLLPLSARFIIYTFVLLITAILLFEFLFWWSSVYVAIPLALFAALSVIGTIDLLQTRHAVLRNYPLTAHIRFILEEIRPEIRQYFLESEKDGTQAAASWATSRASS